MGQNPTLRQAEEQRPAFTTSETCRTWLAAQPLANAVQTQNLLQRQLSLLNQIALAAPERLAILEVLRAPVRSAQEECVKRFAARPLPLAPPEHIALEASLALWRTLNIGYIRCLEALLSGEVAIRPHAAQIIQRLLANLADIQVDTCRGGSMPDETHWQSLHQCYTAAEELDVLNKPVRDSARHGRETVTPAACYAEALLLSMANLNELSLRDQEWVLRWAQRWAIKLAASQTPPEEASAVPLCVDLASRLPPAYRLVAGKSLRYFGTAELRRSLKKRLVMLERGTDPAAMQLGEDCVQPDCGHLLQQIYDRWCKGGTRRRHQRHAADGVCEAVLGFESIHQQLSGQPFKQPGEIDLKQLRKERELISTFDTVKMQTEQMGAMLNLGVKWTQVEIWQMVDQSSAGLGLTRALKQGGKRVGGGQLIAVKPAGTTVPLLACVRWVLESAEHNLRSGIQLFPGAPTPCAVRNRHAARNHVNFERAFLLPAFPKLKQAATLIIPSGWFQTGLRIDLCLKETSEILLTSLVEHGSDFDRVTFV